MPRVRLAIEFGSFFIYATILSVFVDFGDCDFNSHLRLLFSVLLRLCRKANKKRRYIPNEKKVVYSIRKVRNSNEKLSGLGFINDEGTLFCKCVSKNGKQYTRAFDDVDKHCFPVFGKENEYKGYVTMYYEYEGSDIEVEYSVWYKTV